MAQADPTTPYSPVVGAILKSGPSAVAVADPWAQYVEAAATPAAKATGTTTSDPWAQYVQPAPATPASAGPAPAADPWAQYVQPAPAAPQSDGMQDALDQVEGMGKTSAGIGDVGRRLDDLARIGANGMTLGAADKIAGYVLGSGTAAERGKTSQAQADVGPTATTLASVGGALIPTSMAARGVGLAVRAAEALPGLGSLFAAPVAATETAAAIPAGVLARPLAQAAATGATVGAGDAAGHDTSVLSGALTGAAIGAGGQTAGRVAANVGNRIGALFADAPQIPSSAELRSAAQGAYRDADNAGIVYSPNAVARLQGAVQDHMAQFGYAPELQPGGAAVLRSLDRSDGMPTTLAGLDVTRRIAGNMASPTNPSSTTLGSGIKGVIDDFTNNPRPGDIMMGDQQGGLDALNTARQLWQRSSKDADLSDALDAAGLRAGSTGSGGNINNATRQGMRSVLQSRNDWTPDEQAALQQVILGTPAGNALRQVGKLSPEGNGLISALELAGGGGAIAAGHPAALAVPAVGFVAKRLADRSTAQQVAQLGDLIRAGGTRAALQAPPNVLQRFSTGVDDPIMRAIVASQAGPGQ